MSGGAREGSVSSQLVVPPRLNTGGQRSASRLELFFDLAYVLVVLELASGFVEDFTWHGLQVLAGLYVAVWFSWSGFTLYANRFDTDDVVFRVSKLVATASIAGCAASASGATGQFAVPFAACYLAGRLVLLGLYLRAWRHVPEARRTVNVYLNVVGVSSLIWAVSIFLPGEYRYLAWGIAVVVDALGPVVATLRGDSLPLQIEHLPERFGLFVILVLGEGVGGVVRGVHDAGWDRPSVAVGAVGFVVVAAMWWVYFDVGARRGVEELEEAADRDQVPGGAADRRHDLFIYGHLPLTFGVVLAGVGIEELTLHPYTDLPSPYGWVLTAGVIMFLAGVAMVVGGSAHSWRAVWPWPLAAAPLVVAVGVVPVGGSVMIVASCAIVLLALAAYGTLHDDSPSARASST